jgi:hypothetical protein
MTTFTALTDARAHLTHDPWRGFVRGHWSAAVDVRDIHKHLPGSITSDGPGYIYRDLDLVVGPQTDTPSEQAMVPNGGWQMVDRTFHRSL